MKKGPKHALVPPGVFAPDGTGSSRVETYEELRKKVARFNLTSDLFFGKVLEDRAACQEVVRILLGSQEFVVKEVRGQYSIRNVENRSVVMDILAEGQDGRMVNVEMQMVDECDHQRRVRYYLSSMDMSFLEKGEPYERLPDTYMIYITEKDFMNLRMGIYYIDRTVRDEGTVMDNGVREVYVNLTYPCGDEMVDELLGYMKKSDSAYETKTFPNLVNRVRALKDQGEGGGIMCAILEEERAEGREEGREEGITLGIQALIETCRELGNSRTDTKAKLMEKLPMEPFAAEKYMKMYWK